MSEKQTGDMVKPGPRRIESAHLADDDTYILDNGKSYSIAALREAGERYRLSREREG